MLLCLAKSCCEEYTKKYAHGFCFAVLCCGYTLTDFPISIRLTSLALWQSNDCPSASKATLMNMDKYFMWIHSERFHNHNKAKHNKTVCIFLGIYCKSIGVRLNKRDVLLIPALKLPLIASLLTGQTGTEPFNSKVMNNTYQVGNVWLKLFSNGNISVSYFYHLLDLLSDRATAEFVS